MGLAVGIPARKPLTGLVGGLVAGVMAAASFYLLAPLLRYAAMFVAWSATRSRYFAHDA